MIEVRGDLGRWSPAGVVLIGLLLASQTASARMAYTPRGPMDDKCVHVIPNGANVDGKTGNVWVNGSLFMAGDAPGTCANAAPASVSGWEEAISANANWYGLLAGAYVTLNATWVVPSEPLNNDNNSMVMLFPSVEQCSNASCGVGSGGNITDIMQPVLQWNNANNGETHQWEITAEYGSASLGYYQTGGEVVSVGDSIYGELALQSNGQMAHLH